MNTLPQTSLETLSEHQHQPAVLASEKTFSYWKGSVLSVISVCAAFAIGSFAKMYFAIIPHSFGGNSAWFYAAVAVFLIFYSIATLSIERMSLLMGMAFVSAVGIAREFYIPGNYPITLGSVLLILLFMYGTFIVRRMVDDSLQVHFMYMSASLMGRLTFAAGIFFAFVFFLDISSKPLDENNIIMPRALFESAIPVMSKVLAPIVGSDIKLDNTIRQIAENGVDEAIRASGDRSLKQNITAQARTQMVEGAIAQMQQQFKVSLGEDISPDDRLSIVVYNGLLGRFNALAPETRQSVALLLSLAFVFVFQGMSFIGRIIVIPLAFLVYEGLLLAKFVTVTYEHKSKEYIRVI